VVAETADRVVVFYAGQVVEQGPTAEVLRDPQHPYTAALLAAVPTPATDRAEPLAAIPGSVPPLRAMPSGCRFHTRCVQAWDECAREEPQLHALPGARSARCLLHRPGSARKVLDTVSTKGA
jgi:oligopeptide/dipeptide ABC transporter ATP-binding protein